MKLKVQTSPLALGVALLTASAPLHAMTITTYSSAANDRFSAGYPTAPVENASPSFVGASLDWSGVGWAPTDATKSFGFLSPRHYLAARHYGGAPSIRIFANGSLQTYSQASIEDTGLGVVFSGQTLGDTSVGTLTSAVPSSGGLPRYAVLDLNTTSGSNSSTAYTALNILLYGRGPDGNSSTRVGSTLISGVVISGNDHYFTTPRTDVQLEVGDSGSPATHRWTNPNGGQEITLVGNNAAVNATSNFINFLGTFQVMNALNLRMNDDGFALRVVGNPTSTWSGNSNTSIAANAAWGGGQAPSDKFVNFNAATAGSGRAVTVDNNHNLRGLYFLATATASDGFTFSGASALTIGRGGITSYDNSRQVFNANLTLGDSQYWNGGSGGITVQALNTNGKLLEITGTGTNRIEGIVSGSGALAVSGGTLQLTAANTYSGNTWVHNGTLAVDNVSGSATGTGALNVAAGAALVGTGFIGSISTISGSVAPGNGIGTLTVANDVTWNAGNAWLFELGAFAETLSAASLGFSTQDLLKMTGAGSDFLKGSGTGWTFDFAGTGSNGFYRLADWDGTTTFADTDFIASNLTSGKSGNFVVDTATSALYLNVVPETSSTFLLALSLSLALRRRRC